MPQAQTHRNLHKPRHTFLSYQTYRRSPLFLRFIPFFVFVRGRNIPLSATSRDRLFPAYLFNINPKTFVIQWISKRSPAAAFFATGVKLPKIPRVFVVSPTKVFPFARHIIPVLVIAHPSTRPRANTNRQKRRNRCNQHGDNQPIFQHIFHSIPFKKKDGQTLSSLPAFNSQSCD